MSYRLLRPLVQVVQRVLSLVQPGLQYAKQGRLAPEVRPGHLVLSRERAVSHLAVTFFGRVHFITRHTQ